jgi:hypothetical protein
MPTSQYLRSRLDARQPLPAGHPDTWGLITRGTCLEGMPWPGYAASTAQHGGKWALNRNAQVRRER